MQNIKLLLISYRVTTGTEEAKYLPGLPGASMSVLLTTKVRDKDKGTREGKKR